MTENTIFDTQPININTIINKNYRFFIPVYQRPYVWDEVQITKLLEDITNSFGANKEENYYVGNVYVTRKNDNEYDVVDGQQRFTTFWLIALHYFFNTENSQGLKNYIQTSDKVLRLDFDIRVEVYEYLKGLIDRSSNKKYSEVEIQKKNFLRNIHNGIKAIDVFFNDYEGDILELEKYILHKVIFIFNTSPENTDLNSLFTVLGNSGLQLEQSDILKSRLLKTLQTEGKSVEYSRIWEACENMAEYFETSVLSVFKETDRENLSIDNFKCYSSEFFKFSSPKSISFGPKGKTISQILNEETETVEDAKKANEFNRCRSIIGFNSLLIHTLRIYNLQNSKEDILNFNPKELLKTFEAFDKNAQNVKEFLKLLWKVRFAFDRFVVKWRLSSSEDSNSEDEQLLLTSIVRKTDPTNNKNYFSRSNEAYSNSQMLQSVLYFNSGGFAQQYWLTPFLFNILNNKNTNVERSLETIDNYMLPESKKESSFEICKDFSQKKTFDFDGYFSQNLGTHFNHYWFYKLEYLLWKNWDRNDSKIKDYRITSKNSIEHVFPQNNKYETIKHLKDGYLHNFGNLGLLSVGQNSSYSDSIVENKRNDFNKKTVYDSLKLYKIFNSFGENNPWNEEKIEQHKNEMLEILKNHYN